MVCRIKGKNKTNAVEENEIKPEEENNAIEAGFDYVFMLEAATKKFEKKQRQWMLRREGNVVASVRTLPHFVWRDDNWTVKPARKAPIVKIKFKLCPDGYRRAGLPFPRQADCRRKQAVVSITTAMADTGCSMMVTGLNFIYALGITK